MKPIAWAALLGLAVVLVFLLSIRLGSVDLSTGEVFAALLGEGDINVRRIVVELRAPRAVMAILVGGGLSLSGAVFQALLRNPLAEPYILGDFRGSRHRSSSRPRDGPGGLTFLGAPRGRLHRSPARDRSRSEGRSDG